MSKRWRFVSVHFSGFRAPAVLVNSRRHYCVSKASLRRLEKLMRRNNIIPHLFQDGFYFEWDGETYTA